MRVAVNELKKYKRLAHWGGLEKTHFHNHGVFFTLGLIKSPAAIDDL